MKKELKAFLIAALLIAGGIGLYLSRNLEFFHHRESLSNEKVSSKYVTMADFSLFAGEWVDLAGVFDGVVRFVEIKTKPGSFHNHALAVYDDNRHGFVCFPETKPTFYCLPVIFNKSELSPNDRFDEVISGGFSEQLLAGVFNLSPEEELTFVGKLLMVENSAETVLARLRKQHK